MCSEKKGERGERGGGERDWGAHGDSMNLSIEGVTVDKVGHIHSGNHLVNWQYHTSSVNCEY